MDFRIIFQRYFYGQEHQHIINEPPIQPIPQSTLQQRDKQDYLRVKKLQEYLTIVEKVLFFFYATMCFFQMQTVDPNYIYTASIGHMSYETYTVLQTIAMLLLVIGNGLRMTKLKLKQKIYKLCVIFITIVVIIFNLHYWMNGIYFFQVGLILRPFFLVFYSSWLLRCALQAWKVFIECYKYFILLWCILLLFAGLGSLLFGDVIFDNGYQNIFHNLWEAFFFLYVMQTFAYYPDPSLRYYTISKSVAIFFVPVMIINGVMIATVIISTTYTSYQSLTIEQQKNSLKVIQLLYLVVINKINKSAKKKYIDSIFGTKKKILAFIDSKLYNLIMEISSIILFLVLAIDRSSQANKSKSIALFLYAFTIFSQNVARIYALRFKIKYLGFFDFYKLVSSFIIMIAFGYTSIGFQYDNFLVFALFLFPNMLKYILNLLLLSQSAVRYLLRLVNFGGTLYLIILLFAAIGQTLFSHLFNDIQKIEEYLLTHPSNNPGYLYMNFNNTVNSFITLFPVLLGKYFVMDYTNIMDRVVPKIFYLVYHTFGNLVVYKQLISTTLNHIAIQTSREQALSTRKQTCKLYLSNKFEIQRVFESLILALRSQYYKTNQQRYNKQIIDDFSLNFPLPLTQSQMLKDINTFSLNFCNNGNIGDCWLEAATFYTRSLIPINKVLRLNDLINEIKGKNQKWYRVSGRQLLEQKGYNLEDPQEFFQQIKYDLEELGIEVSFEFNKIQALVQKYMLDLNYTDKPVYLFYDFGDKIRNRNIVDLYVNNEPVAISFNYKLQHKLYLIQKIQVSKLGDYFGIDYQAAKQIEQELDNNIL